MHLPMRMCIDDALSKRVGPIFFANGLSYNVIVFAAVEYCILHWGQAACSILYLLN